MLVAELAQIKDPYFLVQLASILGSAAVRLEPRESSRLCGEAASALARAIEREPDRRTRRDLVSALNAVSVRLEPMTANRVATVLAAALEQENDRAAVAMTLGSVSASLERAEAARVCGRAARVVTAALEREQMGLTRNQLIEAIGSLAPCLDAADAARVWLSCAQVLARVLARETDALSQAALAHAFALVSVRLGPEDAAYFCRRAIEPLLRTRHRESTTIEGRRVLDFGISELIAFVPRDRGRGLAFCLAELTIDEDGPGGSGERPNLIGQPTLVLTLTELLTDPDPTVKAMDQTHGLKGTLLEIPVPRGALATVERAPRCRLTTQQLVELLKMPTCHGQARRVVLDFLGYIHEEYFVNHWSFVRFATETKLDVNLIAPPKRPDARASLEQTLTILDPAAARRAEE
jgi:hypothetical protein